MPATCPADLMGPGTGMANVVFRRSGGRFRWLAWALSRARAFGYLSSCVTVTSNTRKGPIAHAASRCAVTMVGSEVSRQIFARLGSCIVVIELSGEELRRDPGPVLLVAPATAGATRCRD